MSDLRLTVCQQPLIWEDKIANLKFWEEKLRPLKGKTDLIVLPEMFTTGFTMNVRELAESMDGPTVTWIRNLAEELGATITGSVIIREECSTGGSGGKFFNRMLGQTLTEVLRGTTSVIASVLRMKTNSSRQEKSGKSLKKTVGK